MKQRLVIIHLREKKSVRLESLRERDPGTDGLTP